MIIDYHPSGVRDIIVYLGYPGYHNDQAQQKRLNTPKVRQLDKRLCSALCANNPWEHPSIANSSASRR